MLRNFFIQILRKIRIKNYRRLFWWKGPPDNVGDWIGPYLFKAISGVDPIYSMPSNKSFFTIIATVGSLARWFRNDTIVWGSGIMTRNDRMTKPYQTYAVRGPYTRERFIDLGYECPECFGDPAMLMPVMYPIKQEKKIRLGIIPHYKNYREAKQIFKNKPDVKVIDVRTTDVESFINEITICNKIISSSLHGLILGHSYKIPAGWVQFTNKISGDGIKFIDYFASAKKKNIPAPMEIKTSIPIKIIEEYIDSTPQPNLEPLRKPLIEACPIKKVIGRTLF